MVLETTAIEKIEHDYFKVSLWIVAGLTLLGLLVSRVLMYSNLVVPLVISAVFSLVSSYMYGKAWKYFAKNSASSLGKFYMGGSMLRMVLAAIVALVGTVVYRTDHEKVLTFVLVFAIFYLAIMIFESIYFIRVEKNNK